MTSRLSLLLLLFAAACGTDTTPDRSTTPDAGMVDGEPSAEPDAGETATSSCDQAKTRADFAFLQEHVFTPSCATAMCHAGAEPEVGLDLGAGKAYGNLVNKGASTVAGWTRVVPGSLATSYLAVSLGRAAGPPPRDGYMPLGADPLCLEKLEAVERWILGGANP